MKTFIEYFPQKTFGMRLNKTILFAAITLLSHINANADNNVVKGKVCSANKEPLQNITVSLLTPDSSFVTGTMTDIKGHYLFDKIERKKYLIHYSSIGYKPAFTTCTVNKDTVDIGYTILEEDQQFLKEVKVTASRYQKTDNGLSVFPSKEQVKYSHSGYDLLEKLMIPGLNINAQKGTVLHFRTDVGLYINGEKADYRRVNNLRPKDIEKVEYMDNPSGIYSNEAYAVNFITKTKEGGGYVSVEGSETLGFEKGEYNIASQISKKNTSFSFWGGFTHYGSNGESTDREENIVTSPVPTNISKKVIGDGTRNNEQYIHAQMRSSFKRGLFSATLGFVNSRMPQNDNFGKVTYNGAVTEQKEQITHVSNNGLSPKLSVFCEYNINASSKLTGSLSMDYNHSIYDRNYQEADYFNSTHARNNFLNGNAEVDYTYKLKDKSKLSATVYNILSNAITKYSGNYKSRQSLFSDETIIFVGYKRNILKNLSLYVRPGISILRQELNDMDKNETSFRLHSKLTYSLSKSQQLAFGYKIGNTVADISSSSSIDQEIDPYHVKRGNPYLKNANLYHYSLEYMLVTKKFNMSFEADYNLTNHFPLMTPYMEDNKIIETYSSDSKSKEYDAGAMFAYMPFKNFSVQAMLVYSKLTSDKWNIYDSDIIMSNVSAMFNHKAFSFKASVAPPYKGVKTGKGGLYAKFRNDWQYSLSASWRNNNLYVEIGTNNPFSKRITNKEYLNVPYYSYEQRVTSGTYQQTAYIKAAYNFDFGNKKIKKDKVKADNTIKDTILR